METFDILSTIGIELTDEQLDISGGLPPILPDPWICLFFPELGGYYWF